MSALQRWAISDACERYVGSPGLTVEQLEAVLELAFRDPWEYACRVKPHLRLVASTDPEYLDYSDGNRILDELAGLTAFDDRPVEARPAGE